MYGLKQAKILAHDDLVKKLHAYIYKTIPQILGLWKHDNKPITLCLYVDDFGIKYFNRSDAVHLLQYIQKNCTPMVEWSGETFCCLTFDWEYQNEYVDVLMPGYVQKLLQKFQHQPPKLPWFSPFPPLHMSKLSRDNANMHQKLIHPHCSPLPKLQGSNKSSVVCSI